MQIILWLLQEQRVYCTCFNKNNKKESAHMWLMPERNLLKRSMIINIHIMSDTTSLQQKLL
jgi:hypothetical protein